MIPWQADPPTPALAVDGKTVRGARRPDGPQVHLLSAMNKAGPVLAQREADAKSNEITAIQPLPAPLEPAGCVVTLERVCAVISLAAHQADAAEIARRVRGHWGIGNRLHHVRDTDFAEGAPASGPGPSPAPWPPCATWPSAPSTWPAATTLPPACAGTHAISPGL